MVYLDEKEFENKRISRRSIAVTLRVESTFVDKDIPLLFRPGGMLYGYNMNLESVYYTYRHLDSPLIRDGFNLLFCCFEDD